MFNLKVVVLDLVKLIGVHKMLPKQFKNYVMEKKIVILMSVIMLWAEILVQDMEKDYMLLINVNVLLIKKLLDKMSFNDENILK